MGRRSVIGLLAEAARQRRTSSDTGKSKVAQGNAARRTSSEDSRDDPQKLVNKSLARSRQSVSSKGPADLKRATLFAGRAGRHESVFRTPFVQDQRKEELRIADAWNLQLSNPANRNNVDLVERFWSEMKVRIIRHYGSICKAFKEADSSGDGLISFLEFADMLRFIHLPMEERTARAMFNQASRGDGQLSLQELKMLLMEKTIQKLQSAMRGFNKKQSRVRVQIHSFLKQVMFANEVTMSRAVDRLQRKLTIPFISEFWKSLASRQVDDMDLERITFQGVLQTKIGVRFMAIEVTFLLRIFDRIDVHRQGHIALRDLMTTLILLSEESSRAKKLNFLFEIFDTDCDGCLLYEEIRAIMVCICTHRPIAEQSATTVQADANASGMTFQEELTAQDGLRLYECLLWYLQRTAKLDSPIVTWRELWQAFEDQPEIENALFPGFFRMQWVLNPSWMEEAQVEEPVIQEMTPMKEPLVTRRLSGTPELGSQRRTSRTDEQAGASEQGESPPRRTLTFSPDSKGSPGGEQLDVQRRTVTFDSKAAATEQLDCQRPSLAFESQRRTTLRVPEQSTPNDQADAQRISLISESQRRSTVTNPKEFDSATSSRRSTVRASRLGSKSKPDLGRHRENLSATEPLETTAAFKHAITSKFLTSLRNFGDVRYAELEEGFKNISLEEQMVTCRDNEGITPGSPTAGDAARPVSAAGAQRFSLDATRPGSSSSAVASTHKYSTPASLKAAADAMPRINSAPAQLGRRANQRSSHVAGQLRAPGSTGFPSIESQRWGLESADRFRLFSTVRSGKNNQRHLVGCQCGGGSADGFGYKCQLCQRQHVLLTSF